MRKRPLVSVVTATHNGAQFLPATFQSIQRQTLQNFEYILVDDGSTDSTPALLNHFQSEDERVVVLHTPSNLGPAGALNLGWQAAHAEFIAILDHDDLAMADRLAKQVAFLQEEPSVGIAGSFVTYIDEQGNPAPNSGHPSELKAHAHRIFPTLSVCVHWTLYFHAALQHSAMTVRKHVLEQAGGYSARHRYACDLELTQRLAGHVQMVNLPEYLACYRLHSSQVSRRLSKLQIGEVLLSLQRMWFDLLHKRVSLNEIATVSQARRGVQASDETTLRKGAELLMQLYTHFVAAMPTRQAIDESEREWLRDDCAFRLYILGYIHRSQFPAASQEILQSACDLDPFVAEHPYNHHRLRQLDKHIMEICTANENSGTTSSSLPD